MMLLDEFKRNCVLVADSRTARIFTLYLGDFEEYPDEYIQHDVPDRVSAKDSMTAEGGGDVWGGLGDQRIQRHIEDHIHRHLKNVSERALQLFKAEKFARLILGGPDDKLLAWLKDHLHSYLRERLVGEFYANPENSKTELKEKALEAAEKYERHREKELIDQLMELKAPGGKAVLGVEPTLEALKLGQVQTLVVHHDFRVSGYICPKDRILSTYLESCPLCEEAMREVEDLADEMVEEALSQSAEVEHIFIDHQEFSDQGVGALLRFTV
jgi:peptide chain release factor subunit 1